jgi:hypothetical protein
VGREEQFADVQVLVIIGALLLGDLTRPQATFWYASLLEESGYGRLPYERAAFLIRESDGTLTIAPWPRGGYRHASFRGLVPTGTIAILHTHPRGDERPSSQDRAAARRLGLPVVTITSEGVIAAMPDGGEVALGSRDYRGENASPRLRNEPWPLRPTYLPSSITTSPRESTVLVTPRTFIPS